MPVISGARHRSTSVDRGRRARGRSRVAGRGRPDAPSTTTRVTSAAVAAKTAVCSSAPVPAVRGRGGVEGDQVGALPDGDARRRRRSRGTSWAVPTSSSSAAVQCPRRCGGQPLVELDGAHLLERVDDGVAVGAEAEPGSRRRAAGAAGPMPSARSRSVVGQKQTLVRRAAEQRDVVVGQVGGVHDGGAAARAGPSSASSRVGVTPYAARQASFSAGCSERCTCSGGPRPRGTRASWSRGTARTEWIARRRRSPPRARPSASAVPSL